MLHAPTGVAGGKLSQLESVESGKGATNGGTLSGTMDACLWGRRCLRDGIAADFYRKLHE